MVAIKRSGVPYSVLDEDMDAEEGTLRVGTMHLAKGLEFRAVAVMACDSEVIPLQSRVESIADERTWKRFTIRSGTCSMWPAPAPGTTCWSPGQSLLLSFLTTYVCELFEGHPTLPRIH